MLRGGGGKVRGGSFFFFFCFFFFFFLFLFFFGKWVMPDRGLGTLFAPMISRVRNLEEVQQRCRPKAASGAGHVSGLGATQHRELAMAAGEMTTAEFTRFLSTALGPDNSAQQRWLTALRLHGLASPAGTTGSRRPARRLPPRGVILARDPTSRKGLGHRRAALRLPQGKGNLLVRVWILLHGTTRSSGVHSA
jgi:hypothetical protein